MMDRGAPFLAAGLAVLAAVVAMFVWWVVIGALAITVGDTPGGDPLLEGLGTYVFYAWPLAAAGCLASALIVGRRPRLAGRILTGAAAALFVPAVVTSVLPALAAQAAFGVKQAVPAPGASQAARPVRLLLAAAIGLLAVAALAWAFFYLVGWAFSR